jgi:hypothetical protein
MKNEYEIIEEKTNLNQRWIVNVLVVMRVKEVEMVDVHLNLMKVMDAVYLMILSDDMEEKQRHKVKRMRALHLHYHDDVLMKMVQQILVYNLNKIINPENLISSTYLDHILQVQKQLPMLLKMIYKQNLYFHLLIYPQ